MTLMSRMGRVVSQCEFAIYNWLGGRREKRGWIVTSAQTVGSVGSLWRYPVKSMLGEEINATLVTKRGLLGDRAYGLIDRSDGKVASAKNPRKWPQLFSFRAVLTDPSNTGRTAPPVRITLPDGDMVSTEQADVDEVLSKALNRDVTLRGIGRSDRETAPTASPGQAVGTSEEYWPDIDGLDHRDTVTDFGLPEGTYFDAAVVHVLTTATLDRLRALYPKGRFEIRRFRPNVVVSSPDGEEDFVENAWLGRTLAIGDDIRLSITVPCPRCVMTTLAQSDLPNDTGILRTAARYNGANVGVYASVLHGGKVRRGDTVRLE